MDIVSRLKFFLEKSAISNSFFADTCQIARPTLSQLLTGRNKKVSDELLGKIHAAYPSLSIMWLMFGEGEMLDDIGQKGNSSSEADKNKNLDIFADSSASTPAVPAFQEPLKSDVTTINFEDPSSDEKKNVGALADGSPLTAALEMISRGTKPAAGDVARQGASASDKEPTPGRKIVNIIVFYDDNSFDSYVSAR